MTSRWESVLTFAGRVPRVPEYPSVDQSRIRENHGFTLRLGDELFSQGLAESLCADVFCRTAGSPHLGNAAKEERP
jgi:hypothetical protein